MLRAIRLRSRTTLGRLLAGASLWLLVLGCNEEVRTTVLGGIQSALTELVTTLIDALFLSLASGSST